MTHPKKVLSIGIEPRLVDFSNFPGLTAEKVHAGLAVEAEKLKSLGYDTTFCLTDLGETAVSVVTDLLAKSSYDCVMIGAGLRNSPSLFLLFEQMINVIHEHAPGARICFNTSPHDTTDAIQRWV